MKNFVEELKWRGLIHDITPSTENYLDKNSTSGYIGFDCTANSLHVGSLLQIMIFRLLQKYGHQPIVLLGGGTTRIGDPSGKDSTRKILKQNDIKKNIKLLSKYKNYILVVINNEFNINKINNDITLRYYGLGAQIIKDYNVRNMILLSRTKKKIIGLEKKESDMILEKIFEHQARLELTCRFSWTENAVAIWDNRSVIHYAIADFFPGRGLGYERIMDRIAIEGDHPQ